MPLVLPLIPFVALLLLLLLRVWRHDVEHLSDAQLAALAAGLRRQQEAV
jgi:hypothetical protein